MSFIALAIGGAALIGGIGSVVAGGEQASGQEQAANTQAGMFNTITSQEQPFLQAGYGATTSLGNLLNGSAGGTDSGTGLPNGYLTQQFNPTQSQLDSYPGYQFQQQQGDLALQSANSATGGALSGSALKQLMSFNQGLAGSNYQNYFNQFQTQQNNIFDRLSGIASLGQNAAGNLGNAGTQLGTGIAQAQAGAAASTAGGIVGATNAVGSAASSLPLYSLLSANQGASSSNFNGLSTDPSSGYSLNVPGGS